MMFRKKKSLFTLDAITLLPFAKSLLEFMQRALVRGVALHAQGETSLEEALTEFLIRK